MSDQHYPWNLENFPNYNAALSIEVQDAKSLTQSIFEKDYVFRNRPCLIKGAVEKWPAHTKWADLDYVVSKIGDVQVQASCTPKIEHFGLRCGERDEIASDTTWMQLLPAEPVRKMLPKIHKSDDDVLFIELRPTDKNAGTVGLLEEDLAVDGQRFTFYRAPPRPRFLYAVWAAMFYKNSYSDWHFHPGTEAIMCQVLGTKEVLLLAPNQYSWDRIVPVHAADWKVYGVDERKYPSWKNLRPYRVTVEPGDGLYIPVNWWHAVQAYPREFGVTVPLSWDSPYRDLRQPATRHYLRKLWQMQKPLAAKVFLEAAYGTLAHSPHHSRSTKHA